MKLLSIANFIGNTPIIGEDWLLAKRSPDVDFAKIHNRRLYEIHVMLTFHSVLVIYTFQLFCDGLKLKNVKFWRQNRCGVMHFNGVRCSVVSRELCCCYLNTGKQKGKLPSLLKNNVYLKRYTISLFILLKVKTTTGILVLVKYYMTLRKENVTVEP